MARLRARLIGGGGQPEVGFGSGVAQGLSNIAEQIAAQYNPDIQMARQLQQLKIQAAQGQLQAAQEAEQQRAGFQRTGEELFPAGGRTREVELGGQEPEQAPVTMPQTTPLTPDERLQKALWQTGNLKALATIKQQQDLLALKQEAMAAKPPAEQPMNIPQLQTLLPGETPEVYATLASLPRGEQLKMITERSQQRREGLAGQRAETAEAGRERREAQHQSNFERMFAQRETAAQKKDTLNNTYIDEDARAHLNPSDQENLIAVPKNSMAARALGPSNMVYNHLNQAINALENIKNRFGNDRSRFIQYFSNSWKVLQNDPDAVKLFRFLHGPNAIAIGNLYSQGAGTGLRNSARLAQILMPSGLEMGDTLTTSIRSKLHPMAELNLGNVEDTGLPTRKFQGQLDRLDRLLRSLNPPPPAGFK